MVKWVAGDPVSPSRTTGLSAVSTANANALFELIPSLEMVVCNERGYVFVFRTLSGKIERRTGRTREAVLFDLGFGQWSLRA